MPRRRSALMVLALLLALVHPISAQDPVTVDVGVPVALTFDVTPEAVKPQPHLVLKYRAYVDDVRQEGIVFTAVAQKVSFTLPAFTTSGTRSVQVRSYWVIQTPGTWRCSKPTAIPGECAEANGPTIQVNVLPPVTPPTPVPVNLQLSGPVEPPPTTPVEICGNGIDDDKDGQIDEGCVVLPPPSSEAHAYFDALCKTAGSVCYALRSQAELDKYRWGRGNYAAKVDYDATAQAAKWQWVTNDNGMVPSAEQVRVPILLERPASGARKLLVILDHRWDQSWLTEFKRPDGGSLDGWKWLQFTGNTEPGATEQRIWFEPQMRYIGYEPPVLSYFAARNYLDVRPPTTEGTQGCGQNFIGMIGPMQACFKSKPNTWTRLWLEVELVAGDIYAKVSMWLADETQEPVQVYNRVETISHGMHTQFWIEYNTSWEQRVGGPMAAWARNVIVLKDADAKSTLQKPVR